MPSTPPCAPAPAGTPAHAPPLHLSPSQMRLERGWVQRPGKTVGALRIGRGCASYPGARSPERLASWCSLGREQGHRVAGRRLLTLRQLHTPACSCVAPITKINAPVGTQRGFPPQCARSGVGGQLRFHVASDACWAHVLPRCGASAHAEHWPCNAQDSRARPRLAAGVTAPRVPSGQVPSTGALSIAAEGPGPGQGRASSCLTNHRKQPRGTAV